MKKLLIIIIILMPFICKSQVYEILKEETSIGDSLVDNEPIKENTYITFSDASIIISHYGTGRSYQVLDVLEDKKFLIYNTINTEGIRSYFYLDKLTDICYFKTDGITVTYTIKTLGHNEG